MNYLITHQLRRIRTDLGYSQEYLASRLKISQSSYSEIENGHVELSLNKLNQIAEILGRSPLDLIEVNGQSVIIRNPDVHNTAIPSEVHVTLISQLSETLLRFINLVENKSNI